MNRTMKTTEWNHCKKFREFNLYDINETRPIVQRCVLSILRYVFCDGGGSGGLGGGGGGGGRGIS